MKHILFVVSGHATMGGGKPAGCYIPELVQPYYVMRDRNIEVDFTSPGKDGPALVGTDVKDPELVKLLSNRRVMGQLLNAVQPSKIDADKYDAIFYTGGHGGMFDFPGDKNLIEIAEHLYAKGKLVTAMCHGPAGLLNLKDSSGEYLVKGHRVTGYSRSEEIYFDTLLDVPFVLGEALEERGAIYSGYCINQGHVIDDGQIITGQNPMSAQLVGNTIADKLMKND